MAVTTGGGKAAALARSKAAALRAGVYHALAVLGWLAVGPLLMISNRSLLTSGLSSPVSLACIHLFASCVFANTMVYCGLNTNQRLATRRQTAKVALLAAVFGLGIAVMQQMLLSGAEGFDSVNLMRFMSLFAVVMLIPLALFLEGPLAFVNTVSDNMQAGNKTFLLILLLNVSCAFAQNILAFLVTKCLGAVAIQVIGAFKGVICVLSSIAVFHNPLSRQSALGYAITTLGVGIFTWLKARKAPAVSASRTSPQRDALPDTQDDLYKPLVGVSVQ
eukprot:jgi/Tetstr1/465715/TSEL_010340.t1